MNADTEHDGQPEEQSAPEQGGANNAEKLERSSLPPDRESGQAVTPDVTTGADPPPRDYSIYHSIHTADAPLEECLNEFWDTGEMLADVSQTSDTEPYEILKRLGPSPFGKSSFPLVGFFASAYERVSRFARERTEA